MTDNGLNPPPPPRLPSLFWSAFIIGLFSFGGGVVAWMIREIVDRRKWLTEREFMVDLAVTRVLPGTNVTNMTVLVGYRLMGTLGAATALFGLVLAPFCIVIAMVYVYDQLSGPVLDATMEGAAAGALGLLALTTYRSMRHAFDGWHTAVVMAGVAFGIVALRAPFIPLILASLAISLALVVWTGHRRAG